MATPARPTPLSLPDRIRHIAARVREWNPGDIYADDHHGTADTLDELAAEVEEAIRESAQHERDERVRELAR